MRGDIGGRRTIGDERIKEFRDADVLCRRSGEHGADDAGGDALFERAGQFGFGELFAFEVFRKQIVVCLGNGLDELLACGRDGARHVRRYVAGRALVADVGFLLDEVDDARKGVLGADRQRQRCDLLAVTRLELRQRLVVVRVLAVHTVDEDDARQPGAVGVRPRHLGADLHTGDGIDNDDADVGGADAALHFADEIGVAGRVDDVDFVVSPLAWDEREAEADFAFDFVGLEVGGGGAIVDSAQARAAAGGEECCFS